MKDDRAEAYQIVWDTLHNLENAGLIDIGCENNFEALTEAILDKIEEFMV